MTPIPQPSKSASASDPEQFNVPKEELRLWNRTGDVPIVRMILF